MKIGYFDSLSGASGDMLLGTLVDAGVDPGVIIRTVDAMQLPDVSVSFEKVMRGYIQATLAKVTTPHSPHERHLPELLKIVDRAGLDPWVNDGAQSVLRRMAEVEAGIHGIPLDHIHLHELGGDDTLVDIVGTLAGIHSLGLDEIVVSPLPMGRGWGKSMHGDLPIPAPATMALLKDVPIRPMEIEFELVTPTGAALLTHLAARFGNFPAMTLRKVGVGAGGRELPFPNVLRLWLGDSGNDGVDLIAETLWMMEANLDDINPQVYGHLMGQLFSAGALDVTLTPTVMKKNRPAVTLAVLCRPEQWNELLSLVFAETTTLGVRREVLERFCLPREMILVETRFGAVHMKVTEWQGKRRAVPEYEDCVRAADANHVPLLEVMQAARAAYEG